MRQCHVMIDGGTTNTRFILMHEGEVLARCGKRAGAGAAEQSGNKPLFAAVRETLLDLEREYGCRITDVFSSGMITSGQGLYELEHIDAPVSFAKLVRAVKKVRLPEISETLDFYFVPGVRFLDQPGFGKDMMRGEETELMGALDDAAEEQNIAFLHFGSHNKLMLVEKGAIVNSVTTVGGELLWAVIQDTILKSGVGDLLGGGKAFSLDGQFVRKGFINSEAQGLTRALFLGRICQVLENAGPEQILSYLYGAILAADAGGFREMLGSRIDRIVLYGRREFVESFRLCKEEILGERAEKISLGEISYEESENLSVRGLLKIREAYWKECK
ncbi:MAG: 2-dehydro-3-deoxygalactonokinase [Clostridiales bacterium]|nr:2-dehydro-3-deoxygalactonokinase [Clostridiales bacterium]